MKTSNCTCTLALSDLSEMVSSTVRLAVVCLRKPFVLQHSFDISPFARIVFEHLPKQIRHVINLVLRQNLPRD